jgi:type IV secretory pathway VirB9-like protein
MCNHILLLLALGASAALAQRAPAAGHTAKPVKTAATLDTAAATAQPFESATPKVKPVAPPSFETPLDYPYSPDDIPIIHTRIRYVTVIILPPTERIIETVCGDKDWWQVDPVENLIYIKPTKAAISTNLTILGKSGMLYQFALEEITEVPNAKPNVRVTVRWPDSLKTAQAAHGPKFVTKAEMDSVVEDYQQQLQVATENARTVQTAAKTVLQDEVTRMRTQYPAELQFDYGIALDTKPFYVRAMYSDKRFTYVKLDAPEAPAIYEIKDGKPNLLNYDFVNGVFIIRRVVDQGYLAIGKAKLHFSRRTK